MKQYDIAAYIWPAYTGQEPRTRIFWPEGIGEWQTVKNEKRDYPQFSEKRQPLWGYVDEADPAVMQMQIDTAADHGVNVFIYDWYWFDNRPFLEGCLNDGFLKAKNNNRMKFYLMWANHDANYCWDVRGASEDWGSTVIWQGAVSPAQFEIISDRLIQNYFTHPLYYTVEGKPVFMIYDIENLIRGLGGADNTKKCLARLQEKTKAAGLPGVHLQITQWGDIQHNLSGVDSASALQEDTPTLARRLGFESASSYQFVHFTDVNRPYPEIMQEVPAIWEKFYQQYDGAYFPHVSIGWDNNPRFRKYRPQVMTENTPENFEKALRKAKEFVDTHPMKAPLITVNSWNEWTETSYLEPDFLHGYGYLEAIQKVFVDQK